MKPLHLLHRYLKQRRGARNARRRKGRATVNPASLIDMRLEPRILLSGTTPEGSADKPAQKTETIAANDSSSPLLINDYLQFATADASFSPKQQATVSVQPTEGNLSFRISNSTAVSLTSAHNNPSPAPRPPQISQKPAANPRSQIVSENLRNLTETLPVAASLATSSALTSPTQPAATTAPTERLSNDVEALADNPTSTAAAESVAASPETLLHLDTAFTDSEAIPGISSQYSPATLSSIHRTAAFETPNTHLLRQQRQIDATLQPITRNTQQQRPTPNQPASTTSVSNIVASFSDLAEILIPLDRTHLTPANDIEIDEWLNDQLGFSGITQRQKKPSNKEAIDACVEQTTSEESHEDNQRLQNAWLRLDLMTEASGVLTALGNTPPDQPEISGIWQRLKFDSNPRGPPVSDHIPASEFTRQTASAMQLKQLRHSIAPRGPSAASVR